MATAGTHEFRTFADDGVRLTIGGTTVISDNAHHAEIALTSSIDLTPGTYSIERVFVEGGG